MATCRPSEPFVPDAGSFRDRSNRVFDDGTRIWRGVNGGAYEHWKALSQTEFFRALVASGKVVRSEVVTPDEARSVVGLHDWAAVLAHERIPFVSYPYEWCFSMLKDAALLHLELLERALENGWTLKDSSAFNVQWMGTTPVFIDTPSFEPRVSGTGWAGYRQFCMMFLFPLMLRAYKGIDYIPLLRSDLEGIEPLLANRMLGGLSRFRRGVLSHVSLQAKLQSRAQQMDLDEAAGLAECTGRSVKPPRRIRYTDPMVIGLVQSLRRLVQRLQLSKSESIWQDYASTHSYAAQSFELKREFVTQHASGKRRRIVWDLGCNTGVFSEIASGCAEHIVAMDSDGNAIDRLYQRCKAHAPANVLPLVINITNPSPGQGWRGAERKPLEGRARPDLILCLALVHHLVIGANIPLVEVIEWLHELGGDLIIEFVGFEDPMVQMLMRNRINQHHDYRISTFEQHCARYFETIASEPVKGGMRTLYHLKRRDGYSGRRHVE